MDIIKHEYFKWLFLLISALSVSSYSNDISAKALFDNASFTGKVKHKKPIGQGVLQLAYQQYDVEIPGVFSNDTIYNGSFLGIEGTFKYSLEKSKNKYPVGNGLYQHDRYFPILTINVIEGEIYGLDCFERPYDIILRNSPEMTLEYRCRYNESLGYNISVPQWIVEVEGGNEQTVSFQIEPNNRSGKAKLSVSWIKTTTPEYEITYNQGKGEGLLFVFKNGDTATLDHYGNTGYTFKLKDGSVFSHEARAKVSTLTYPDNSSYTGTFDKLGTIDLNKDPENLFEVRDSLDALPDSHGLNYYSGTLTQTDGSSIKYAQGKSEHQIEQERLARERAERQAYQEQERRENAQTQAKHRALVNRYGERTANAIEEDEPYIGMSEAAFKEIDGSYYVYEQSVNGTTYARKSWFKGNKYYKNGFISGYVVCQNGKIVRIINL